jgi:hypothetical protein
MSYFQKAKSLGEIAAGANSSTHLQTELLSVISLLESTIDKEEDEKDTDENNSSMVDDEGMSNLQIAVEVLLGTRSAGNSSSRTFSSSSSSTSMAETPKKGKHNHRKNKLKSAFAESFWEALRIRTNKINAARRKENDILNFLDVSKHIESYTSSGPLFKLILSTSPSPLKQSLKQRKQDHSADPVSIGNLLRSVGLISRVKQQRVNKGGASASSSSSSSSSLFESKRRNFKEPFLGQERDPFRETLEFVVRKLVEDKVRAAVLKKDVDVDENGHIIEKNEEEEEEEEEEEHRRILPLTLRWCEHVLMPWLALLIIGQDGLKNAMTRIKLRNQQQQKEQTQQYNQDEKKNELNHQSPSHPSIPNHTLPSPSPSHLQHQHHHHYHQHRYSSSIINRIPHTHFSLTSCIAPELDDGSGGAVGVEDTHVNEEGGYSIDEYADVDARFFEDMSELLGISINPSVINAANNNDDDDDADLFRGLTLLRGCDRLAFIHAHESVARAHSEEAFNLVRDWPSSKPALIDLRESMAVAGVNSRGRFVSSIVHSFKTRLLHAGVATASVLDVCLLAVRSLRVVDVSGVMLALIVDPLQAFLRSRPDTIRCIVSSLTEDTGSELYKELEAGRGGGEGGEGGSGRRRPWDESGVGGADDSDEEGCDAEDVLDLDAEDMANATERRIKESKEMIVDEDDEEGDNDEGEKEDHRIENNSLRMDEEEVFTSAKTKSSKPLSRRHLLQNLRKIFRPSVRQRIPTNPFTRGEAMFRSKNTYSVFSDAKDAAAARVLLSRPRGMWYPAPSAIDSTRDGILRGTHNSGDLLTLLVNIYGSRELFVIEYSRVLSQRLLSKPFSDFVLDQEERTVELLKVRFGEAAMVKCEAMMKDMVESKRISHAIRSLAEKNKATSSISSASASASGGSVVNTGSSNLAPNVAVELFPSGTGSEMKDANDISSSSSPPPPPPLPPSPPPPPSTTTTYVDEIEIDCVIVSGKFWPSWQSPKSVSTIGSQQSQQTLPPITNQPENALLAESLRKVFDSYATRFADVRKPRELILSPHMGEVTAELEFPVSAEEGAERKTMTVTGTPQQLSALLILAEEGENGIFIPVSVLASKLRLTLNATLRLLSHWTSTSNLLSIYQHKKKGTLVYVTSCLPTTLQSTQSDSRPQTDRTGKSQSADHLMTSSSSSTSPTIEGSRKGESGEDGRSTSPSGGVAAFINGDIGDDMQGDEQGGTDAANNSEAESVWTSYITGMLTNLGKLPLDRIHNTLGLFASMGDYPYRKSQQETGRFLGELARAGKIDSNDGLYSIR